MILANSFHVPVLPDEVIDKLNIKRGGKYIDATLGGGGYSKEIIKRGGIVLGIDQDKIAIKFCQNNFKSKKILIERGNFKNIKKIAERRNFLKVNGVIFDLGMSTYQLEKSGRGFSFKQEEALDMRMDQGNNVTGEKIINELSEGELYEIFTKYAEEFYSRTIAKHIVRSRALNRIQSTRQLKRIISEVIESKNRLRTHMFGEKRDVYARIFQAIRIKVNDEINNLKVGLRDSFDLLDIKGRMVVISYHSLEDRVVKQYFMGLKKQNKVTILTKKPIRATYKETCINPKAKGAKLRSVEKI